MIKEKNKYIKMVYIWGIFVSSFFSGHKKTKKCFNPWLGETFDYEFKKIGLNFVIEQVSHHPPISAIYSENEEIIFEGHNHVKPELTLKGFIVKSFIRYSIKFKKTGEHFEIRWPDISIHNLFIGKIYFWMFNSMICFDKNTKEEIKLKFEKHSSFEIKKKYRASGIVKNSNNEDIYKLECNWTQYLNLIDLNTNKTIEIIKKKEDLIDYDKQYYFTFLDLQLNHLNKTLLKDICPTDSRLRPDVRALEFQDTILGSKEKYRLENNQRNRKKIRDKNNIEYKPKYFKKIKLENSFYYEFLHNYWDKKKLRKWDDIDDIFG